MFQELIETGNKLGFSISYKVQKSPKEFPEVFIIGEEFINSASVALILRDNLFYNYRFIRMLEKGMKKEKGIIIFDYYVKNLEYCNIVDLDSDGKISLLEEKYKNLKNNYIILKICFYGNSIINYGVKGMNEVSHEYEISSSSIRCWIKYFHTTIFIFIIMKYTIGNFSKV